MNSARKGGDDSPPGDRYRPDAAIALPMLPSWLPRPANWRGAAPGHDGHADISATIRRNFGKIS
jgi:hypothetical protein